MPSPIAHITAGYIVYRLSKSQLPVNSRRFWITPLNLVIIASFSLLPDLDSIFGFVFGDMERFHNNLSHSIAAGLIVAFIFSGYIYRRNKPYALPWFVVALISYELHVLLDLFTGERGIMLLWPLMDDRFTAPIKLFYGVQWGNGVFSIWHLWTIFTEVMTSLLALLGMYVFKKLVYAKAF